MIDNYTIQKHITQGSHSEIFLVQDSQGKSFISKTMYYTSDSTKSLVSSYLQTETSTLRSCINSKTIHLLASSLEGKHISSSSEKPCAYLISSFCSLGSLENLIKLSPNETICKFFFKKIILALESLHSQQVFHLNIRPENILIDSNLEVRFCGFSQASSKELTTSCKTSAFAAPEMIGSKGALSKKCDIFAVGVVLFIIVTGHPPFLRATSADQYFKLLQGKKANYWKIFKKTSEEFKELVVGMLKMNDSERFDLQRVKQHRWVNGEFCIDEIDNIRRKLTRND
jgi:serine/threonine protein kinase